MAIDLVEKFGSVYPEHTQVFREGDHGDEMFIIHTGEVKILKKARNAEQVLAVLHDGDFFGEMAVFTDSVRSATATVTKKSVLLKIDKNSFRFMLQNNSEFAMNLIKTLCERLKRTDEQIEELLVLSKETRILKAMEGYWKVNGLKDATGANLLLPFEGFMQYVRKNLGISDDDTKASLLKFKQQDLVHVRKDNSGMIYVSFSPKVFSYLKTFN